MGPIRSVGKSCCYNNRPPRAKHNLTTVIAIRIARTPACGGRAHRGGSHHGADRAFDGRRAYTTLEACGASARARACKFGEISHALVRLFAAFRERRAAEARLPADPVPAAGGALGRWGRRRWSDV